MLEARPPHLSINHLRNLNRSLIKSQSSLFLSQENYEDDCVEESSIPDYISSQCSSISTIEDLSNQVKSEIARDQRCSLNCDREEAVTQCQVGIAPSAPGQLETFHFQQLQTGDHPRLPDVERSSLTKSVRQTDLEKELAEGLMVEEADMEICDPCICYSKCWLDTVASLFCVSLL